MATTQPPRAAAHLGPGKAVRTGGWPRCGLRRLQLPGSCQLAQLVQALCAAAGAAGPRQWCPGQLLPLLWLPLLLLLLRLLLLRLLLLHLLLLHLFLLGLILLLCKQMLLSRSNTLGLLELALLTLPLLLTLAQQLLQRLLAVPYGVLRGVSQAGRAAGRAVKGGAGLGRRVPAAHDKVTC
jgi:hypothetical protein